MADEKKIYVFSGKFSSLDEACKYSQPQWSPEPDESATDEEYAMWEDNNPSYQLKRNIDNYLDEDFIETIGDESMDRHDYLASCLLKNDDLDIIKATEPNGANFFVLVYETAFDGFELKREPVSTKELSYCGVFGCAY